MMTRLILVPALAFCLILSSLAGVVAQTRMVAAGGFCGYGVPQLLLDHAGIPVLDGDGEAIATPDCTTCHLSFALAHPVAQTSSHPTLVDAAMPASQAAFLPLSLRLDRHARAPPRPA